MSYLRDTTQNFTINDISLIGSNKFTSIPSGAVHLGRDEATIWLRLDITFTESTSKDYFLDLECMLLNYIDFYYLNASKWELIQGGSERAFSNRILDYRYFAFPINSSIKTQTVYYKLRSKNALNFYLDLKEAPVFYRETYTEEVGHGIFIGMMLLVMLSNLIFYFALKDRSFLIYVGYMFFTLCTNLILNGYISKYILSSISGWQNYAFTISLASTLSFAVWFAYEFLNLRKEKVLTTYILKPIVTGVLLMSIFSPLLSYTKVNIILQVLTLVFFVLVIYAGLKSFQKGHRYASFYIAAYVGYLFFIAPVMLLVFNVLNRNFISTYGAELGAIVESVLLAIALGARYNHEKNKIEEEGKSILEENLNLQKKLKSKLEKEVEERTKELNRALHQLSNQKEEIECQKESIEEQNKRLEKMNESKSRFISILAHDVKGPINSLFSFSELLKNHIDNLSREELIGLGKKLGNHTKNLFSLLENLLQWSRAQSGGINKNPVTLNITEIVNENIALAQMVASPKNIEIVFEPVSGKIYADKDMFNLVLRNLIANAVKFSYAGDKIIIMVEKSSNEALFMVSDHGVGISPKVQEKLFDIASKHCTPGTKGESGTGLGLKLCKEFVLLNNGQIWVESKFNQGSTFYFTLPLAKNVVRAPH